MAHIMQSIASMHEGSKSIWERVLQLEKNVDPNRLEELLNTDFDDTAGLNSIAGLLARDWKKRELLEENDAVFRVLTFKTKLTKTPPPSLRLCLKRKSKLSLRRFGKVRQTYEQYHWHITEQDGAEDIMRFFLTDKTR